MPSFTARTSGSADTRHDGPVPLTTALVAPAGARAAVPADLPAQAVTWPVRAGAVPPLAEAFAVRPDSRPRIGALLEPGAAVALAPGQEGAAQTSGWLGSCGKTQLASYLAGALWQSRGVGLLAWVNASSRASVLSGYMEAAARLGLDHHGNAESVAARFLGWLGGTARPWLVVLDGLRDLADLGGLPGGPAGRVLVTTADAAAVRGWEQAVAVPVPAFSMRESMAYLFDRLSTDPEQRSGTYDLAEHLGGEPTALAQAGAVMAWSGTGCRDYQRRFARQRERLEEAAGRALPAAAVTWMLSADYAEELLPGGGTWPLLVLAALLDSGESRWPCSPARPPAGTSPTSARAPRLARSRRSWPSRPWNAPGLYPPTRPLCV
jgi:hypothetical protein